MSGDDWWWRRPDGVLMVRYRNGGGIFVSAPVRPRGFDKWNPRPANKGPNPKRITLALDAGGFYGPEVDEALGVADAFDTVVDAWEAGTLVPSDEDMQRLATLTGYAPGWFYRDDPPAIDGPMFMCDRASGVDVAHQSDENTRRGVSEGYTRRNGAETP